jgi:predicted amino acid racemase
MPELYVDTEIIGRNTEVVATLLRRHGLALVGVTKGCLGEPRVAAAMVAGGAVALADTRDGNLRRLREALPDVELHRLHLPSLGEPFDPGDVTYVSSKAGAAAVAAVPAPAGPPPCGSFLQAGGRVARSPRKVMLHVETGDQREGVPEEGLLDLAAAVAADSRLELAGIATNYACFHGVPSGIRASVEAMSRAASQMLTAGLPVGRVSGGNSSLLALLAAGESLPGEITELRCGEALLLGQETLFYRPLPGCSSACRLRAEVLEEYTKPARESGRRRFVLDLGRQDLGGGAVTFSEPGLSEIGRSGDYLVVDAEAARPGARIGAIIEMVPSYEALVAAFTSPYVRLHIR